MRLLPILLALGLATPAVAQVRPGEPWPGASIGEQHRHEMQRLRANAEAQEALARQQRLEARLTVLGLQAARQSPPAPTAPWTPPAGSQDQERTAREAAAQRRLEAQTAVAQIDAWLYRAPR